MKPFFFLTLFILLSLATPTWAEVVLQLPYSVKIVAANGENTNLVESVRLPDGVNQLAFRLETEFGHSVDDTEMYYSDVFVLKFEASGAQLALQPFGIRNESQLNRFNRDPEVRIIDQNGNDLATEIDKLKKEGFQLVRDYQQELIDFNKSDSPAAVGHLVTSQSLQHPTSASSQAEPRTDQEEMAEAMLKYWYQQADDATRERFKAWINN